MSNNNKAITHLLSLPNELFPYLFNYLSSSEILKAFLELSENNVRLASLIMPYLCYINLSHESNFWLNTRLPKFNEIIHSICATTRQLVYLRDLPSLQILTIVEINSTDELIIGLQSLSIRLSQLDSIKLNFCLQHDIYHLDNNFDIPLKNFDLSLRCSFLPTGSLISSLRHLTICVNTIRDLFQLGQQLPMIESLFVNVYGSSAESHSFLQQFNSFIACSPYLKRIALYSQEIIPPKFWRLYPIEFEYFEIFIRGCSSSLEYLTLDLILQNQTKTSLVDGNRLEQGVIAFLPHLKRFEFYIEFEIDVKCIAKYQSSFTSELWRQRCIVINYPVTAMLPVSGTINMIVFSLTHTSTTFEELSIVSSQIVDWNSNICSTIHRNLLILDTVRSITISPMSRDAILTLDLFHWMITSFPRLRCLKLIRKNNMEWQLEDETISYPIFDTVRILYLHGQFSCQLIRRFLFMCPRLKYLNVSRKKLLEQIITEPELNNDPYLKNIYQQILQIELSGSGDYVDFKGQLRDFFPRAYFL
ncbi:unnamed protein product [Rotaria sordida]|uniref:F-box domain-containing protein n=1 Tax=Rotaria sordida TaxID=392033 RepID=A0A815GH64_9BILA|nr:unnamed protein product [Rotaria sordida]